MVSNMRTVASILKKVREQKGLTLEQAQQDLKIHPRFLQALEEGTYEIFSSPVHLKGFLKNYAEYLGLNVEQILAFWRREYDEEKGKKRTLEISPLSSPFSITPGIVVGVFTVVLVLAFFLYLAFAYRSFAEAPLLNLDGLATDLKTSSSTLRVSGKADRDAVLSINGQKISLGENGQFAETLSLSPGVNVINFLAVNKLGKERKITRTIIVEEGTSGSGQSETALTKEASSPAAPEIYGSEVILKIGPQASWLDITEGETTLYKGLALSGFEKTFRSRNSIRVRAGNGGSVRAVVNGKDLGPLGEEGQVVYKNFP
ncbi:MAG: RodZ domain-containing protein [Patescibacteria group bacterium]